MSTSPSSSSTTLGSNSSALHATSLSGISKRYKRVHVFWLAGMSCDGCSIAVTGATSPSVEELLAGSVPGLPQLILHHPVLAVEAGDDFTQAFHRAWRGELEDPYVVVLEGSIPNEKLATKQGGYWSAMGADGASDDPWQAQPIPTATWIERLAPGAAAMIAIGTCATWGGIPAAVDNPTGSMGLMDFLGKDYRSGLGLPVINIPGCSPIGDNFNETVAVVLMFLQGHGPLPEFDELGRPTWLFGETVHRGCTRAGYYEEGTFAKEYGDRECLVEIGCWGPVVQCNIVSRGALNGVGGCMKTGGVCIGCTMPGFPDKFSPFYKAPPGSEVSGTLSRLVGSFIRPLRRMTQKTRNRTRQWKPGEEPTGWGEPSQPSVVERANDYFYHKLQFLGYREPGHDK